MDFFSDALIDAALRSHLKMHYYTVCITKDYHTGDRYVIETDGLLIKKVNREDAGTYTCRARVLETGSLEERDIKMEVSECLYSSIRVNVHTGLFTKVRASILRDFDKPYF